MLFIHISIAVLSVIVSGLTYVRPTNRLFSSSYILVASTLISGTYLVLQAPTHLGTACISGLAYLAFVGAIIAAARLKFVANH